MPAITVDDITTLQRLPQVAPTATPRRVRSVTTAPGGFEGEGFPVRRAFAGVDLTELDPFIHMDQMGEVEYAPGEPKGTPWHPHRGFETVTYIMDGIFEHQDSNGGGGVITNGDTQWMTAGAGILHIEKPPEHLVVSGGLFHGLQLWVNLPKAEKWAAPRYQDLRGNEVSLLASSDAGALVRVIAGDLAGRSGPGDTYTPMTMVHATLSPGATLEVPWDPAFNALAYVLAGAGTVGVERIAVATGQLAVFGSGDSITVQAAEVQESRSPALEVLLLGGRPIREPVAWMGPFVMNTRDELVQAYEDYQAGKLGTIPAVHNTPSEIVESAQEGVEPGV
jgi:redox-sensitive bicupin YhaK (pirin superfamily)